MFIYTNTSTNDVINKRRIYLFLYKKVNNSIFKSEKQLKLRPRTSTHLLSHKKILYTAAELSNVTVDGVKINIIKYTSKFSI